ncbi:MAG: enoyl-ACP reductase [Gammaproteobacteria bacterium]|nr:enoyl-ACP reductase [Gammaproteobacteria bacterium]MBK81751.1 enoyl-ACP reductase [Gammaproteobacteria bacterium]
MERRYREPADGTAPHFDTTVTRLLGIRHPILLAQMTRVSTPALVAAVSEAGGLGVLATATLSADATRQAIREIRRRTDAPFGVGVPLLLPTGRENAEAALAERVPVIVFSLGNGAWLVPRAREYGGRIIATVTTARHAQAAARAGCDAVQVIGNEGAGHGSAVGSLVLLPTIRDAVSIPIIAAGGFGDGRGLVAALALGAGAVAMGTRFATAAESPLHPATLQHVLEKQSEDTLYTDRFDGMDCRVLRTPRSERLERERGGLMTALAASPGLARDLGLPWLGLLARILRHGPEHTLRLARMGAAQRAMQRAIEEGDLERGVQPIGQVQGLVRDAPPAADILRRMMEEAARAAAGIEECMDIGASRTTPLQRSDS